jgi:hypothetical protein
MNLIFFLFFLPPTPHPISLKVQRALTFRELNLCARTRFDRASRQEFHAALLKIEGTAQNIVVC